MATDGSELFEVLADLEAEAETLHHLERAAEVADRTRAEYHGVPLRGRLVATLGASVSLGVRGVGTLDGVLDRVAEGWCRVDAGPWRWTVLLSAVFTVGGASERAVPEVAWSRLDAVGVGSPLRAEADARTWLVLHLTDGSHLEGRVRRVGSDFLELDPGSRQRGRTLLVPFGAVAAWRSDDGGSVPT